MASERNVLTKLFKTTLFAAGGLHLINKYIDKEYQNNTTLSYGNGRTFVWNKMKVYYRVTGEGKTPILLVHDASPDSSGEEWRDLEMYLRPSFRIYTVDLPGCGRSDKKTSTYTNFFYVQFLSEFIRNVIHEKTVLITEGLSGSFAVMTAYAHPELVSYLLMITPTDLQKLKTVPDRKGRSLRALLHFPIIGTTVYYIVMNKRNMEYKIEQKLVHNPFVLKQRIIRRAYDSAHAGEGDGRNLLASREGGYLNWNIDRAVHSLTVPAALIMGEHTKGAQLISNRYKKRNHSIETYIIDSSALLPQIENPSSVAEVILQFTKV